MYHCRIPIGEEKAVSDLLIARKISHTDFAHWHILHRHATWGYISKTVAKPTTWWAHLFGCTYHNFYKIIRRLKKLNLICDCPNKEAPQAFLVFEEQLTEKEQAHYINILKRNPKWNCIKEKEDIVEFTPTERQFSDGTVHHDGFIWECTYGGNMFKRDGKIALNVPEAVKDHFRMKKEREKVASED